MFFPYPNLTVHRWCSWSWSHILLLMQWAFDIIQTVAWESRDWTMKFLLNFPCSYEFTGQLLVSCHLQSKMVIWDSNILACFTEMGKIAEITELLCSTCVLEHLRKLLSKYLLSLKKNNFFCLLEFSVLYIARYAALRRMRAGVWNREKVLLRSLFKVRVFQTEATAWLADDNDKRRSPGKGVEMIIIFHHLCKWKKN